MSPLPNRDQLKLPQSTHWHSYRTVRLSQRHRLSRLDLHSRRFSPLRVRIEKNVYVARFPGAIKVAPRDAILIRAMFAP